MNPWKRAILRVAEQEYEGIALEHPPIADSTAGLICPNCGQMEANVQAVYDAEVEPSGQPPEPVMMAVCSCGCQFPPMMESQARQTISEVFARRQKRMNRVRNDPEFALKKEIFRLLSR